MRDAVIAIASTCCLLFSVTGHADSLDDIIESTFRPAVVKIDVSSNTAVIRDNRNICTSEGTGFVVSPNHVITAEHVYQLDPECGERIILIKSNPYGVQKLGTVVAARNDVALLRVDADFPAGMCALVVSLKDVYGTQAIRFGIPGGFSEPYGAQGLRIGQERTGFWPLIVMSPTAAEKGESGGPVIHYFNVVGITRARHEKYPNYSFMTTGSTIRAVLTENGISPKGHICNPVETSSPTSTDDTSIFGNVFGNLFSRNVIGDLLGGSVRKMRKIEPPTPSEIFATIKLDKRLTASNSSITPDTLNHVSKKFNDSLVTITANRADADVRIQGRVPSKTDYEKIEYKVSQTTDNVSQELQATLWKKYIADGEKAGKWKNIPAPPTGPAPAATSK